MVESDVSSKLVVVLVVLSTKIIVLCRSLT